jgi:hypothetical protein
MESLVRLQSVQVWQRDERGNHVRTCHKLRDSQFHFVTVTASCLEDFLASRTYDGSPMRRTRSWKRESERNGSKQGRSRTPGLNRSS